MRSLIVYASATGTTKKCAEMIKEGLINEEVVCVNVEEKDSKINVGEFDKIILGTPVRMFMFNSKIKKFIAKNKKELQSKKVFAFICCGQIERASKYEQSLEKRLQTAQAVVCVGGEFCPENAKNKMDKSMLTSIVEDMSKQGKELPKIDEQKVFKLIEKIKEIC